MSSEKRKDAESFQSSAPSWQRERIAAGKHARKKVPFEAQATYRAAPHRDPLKILEEQNQERLQDLVPLRMSRMIENPFSYFRGAAGPMAADLSHGPFSGGRVFVCGDAHINNFGVYAAPDGRLVFDVNDLTSRPSGLGSGTSRDV